MAELTEKERFLLTLTANGADRFPFYDLEPAEETVNRWRRQGLPPNRSVADFFRLEGHHTVGPVVRSYPYFGKVSNLLDDDDAFERHYDLGHPNRFADDYVNRAKRLNAKGRVLYVDAGGGGLLQMLGVRDWKSMEAAMYAFVERPARVQELVDKTTDFHCLCLERLLSEVPVDYASFYEPIASNKGPVISPAMFKRFALPGYRKVLALLDKYRVPLRFLCTTGGDLTSLLPCLLEAGINGLWISNILTANMTYASLRRTYGPDLALIGGIDATALSRDAKAVRRVVEETVPELLESGRYLPCLDDRPRSNIPFAQYALYRKCLDAFA